MKNNITEIIKDLFISILFIICIVIILSLVFYDEIAISRIVPDAEEYFLTEEMQQEIEEINLEETEEVIINYHIDNVDLKKYEKNKEYIKGKNNPFAITSTYTGNENSNNSVPSDSNNINEGFYEDEGIK